MEVSGTGREKSKNLLGRKWTGMHANGIGDGARFRLPSLQADNSSSRISVKGILLQHLS